MTALASNYRTFELPWTQSDAEERTFRRFLAIGFCLWLVLVVGSRLMPRLCGRAPRRCRRKL